MKSSRFAPIKFRGSVLFIAEVALAILLTAFSGHREKGTARQTAGNNQRTAHNPFMILKPANFRHYIDQLNGNYHTQNTNLISSQEAFNWLQDNIPFFDCPDKQLEEMYYSRWCAFRKLVKQTPDGFVIMAATGNTSGAGKYNTVTSAAGQQFYEGRWLRDRNYLKDYAYFLFKKGGVQEPAGFWAADAIRAWSMVTQDQQLAIDLYPELIANYQAWEKNYQDKNGLFWQIEEGSGKKIFSPDLNSYLFGDYMAMSQIARWTQTSAHAQITQALKAFSDGQAMDFRMKAEKLRELVEGNLWDERLGFYKTKLPEGFGDDEKTCQASGLLPWYFNLPNPGREEAWRQLKINLRDSSTNPFTESQLLTAMANLLNQYRQNYIDKQDYLKRLRSYAQSLQQNPAQAFSTFNDLIISGLIGLRPRMDHAVEINPLVPEGAMDYFCLDGVRYHDRDLTIVWDRTGKHYNKGKGLRIFADGQEIGATLGLQWLKANLPQTRSGWKKYAANPLIGGGKMAGVMDITVMKENGEYNMFGTVWKRQQIVVFKSTDGIHWTEPEGIFSPNPNSGWEKGVNRQAIVKRPDGYHMWYLGSENGIGKIGYATSADGKTYKRMSDQPVMVPDKPWEGTAVMCPHVIWDEDMKLFRMWYSAGNLWEPTAIGYATSADGLHWTKDPRNPIFSAEPKNVWEQERVSVGQVFPRGKWYYMFYIGYRDIDHAQIGIARSPDGITNWERLPGNPIISPEQDGFDKQACYKPFVVFDGKKWLLWYNGGRGWLERIALVTHEGESFGFEEK